MFLIVCFSLGGAHVCKAHRQYQAVFFVKNWYVNGGQATC